MEGQDFEDFEPPKELRARDGRRVGNRVKNGGARPNSGPKPSIAKIEAKLRRELNAEFWVQMAETYGPTFIEVVMNDDVPWDIRLKTWQEINNRAYGKPKETLKADITGTFSLTSLLHAAKSDGDASPS